MTSRRLVLIRHAKAENNASSDSERTLAGRGRRDAVAVGRWLADHDIEPDSVVMSPARRTRETWELAMSQLGFSPPTAVDARIYENTTEDVLEVIREAAPDVTTLVIVGHNPSMHALAAELDDGTESASQPELHRGFPTSGIAVLVVDRAWADVGPATATLEQFAAPRG